ncbi:MAG: NADH-quinone oxidoreductase subunit L [Myxococcota bacterium]
MTRLHLIPLAPLLGAAICLVGARALRRTTVHVVACGSVLSAFLFSISAFVAIRHGGELREDAFTWIAAGDLRVGAAFLFDHLSGTLALVITGVGFLIHVYSTGYMHDDPSYARYFGYLNLFTGSMLVLVLADSLPLMFVGWEGVGACSYLLIGFWFHKQENADAGRKAFLVNRVGDAGFLLGIFVLWTFTGALDFAGLRANVDALGAPWLGGFSAATWAAALLFVGATGKSAQLPLYVWLPDAMAGPTPVSALIHAATMVTAGVYMVARLGFLYALAPAVLFAVAACGAATALYAATIGFAQTDIKRVLAYSTISQLGFMFLGVGAGEAEAGLFHLVTHAFFKACLFLGAGSVIHAMGGRQDVADMGGLRKKLPLTHATFLVATAAIAGVPPLSGFFSKDEILAAALHAHPALFAAGLLAAACTAFYMTRLYCLVFTGECRADAHVQAHLHESPPSMTIPLVVLAALAAVAGLPRLHFDPIVGGASVFATVVGVFVAARLYWGGAKPAARHFSATFPRLYSAVLHKYRVDEIYDFLLVRPLKGLAFVLHEVMDRRLIDGLGVHAGPQIASGLGWIARRLQNGDVQRYAALMAAGAAVIVYLALGGA